MDHNLSFASRRRWTAAQRQRLLARYHRGKLSQAAFAARHGLGFSTLTRWLSQERTAATSPIQFAEVPLPAASTAWAVEIVSPQGWTLRWRQPVTETTLSQLLRALPCSP